MPWLYGAAIAAAYSNSLSIGFHFDDWHVVEKNPAIRTLSNVGAFFVNADLSSVLHDNRTLRPLLLASYALNYAVSGADAWGFHVVNVVLHWLVVLLVWRIVRDHLWLGEAAVPVAATAALLVAVHPLNTSAVDYIAARSAILQAIFYLGAFDLAVRERWLPSLALLALALLTKEIAFTLPLVVLAYWRVAGRRPHWGYLGAAAVVSVLGLLYRALMLPAGVVAATHGSDTTSWVYFMTGWSAYLYYLRLFLWPDALVVDRLDYPLAHTLLAPQAWGSLLALIALGAVAWRVGRRVPAVTFAALWFALTLAAESTVFPLAEPVNEHRPYLAMLGLGTLAALALFRLASIVARRFDRPATAVFATTVLAVGLVLGTATHARNAVWHGDDTLWLDAVAKAPSSTRAWTNAGHALMQVGRYDEARRLLLEGHRLAPCYSFALINLSVVERHLGDDAASLRWAEDGVRCNPGFALAHYYHGLILEHLGRDDEAAAAYRQATSIHAVFTDAWVQLASLLQRREQWADAGDAWAAAFRSDPTNLEAAINAGVIYRVRLGDPARATDLFRAVLARLPTHYGAHYQLAVALYAAGRTEEARAAWAEFVPLAKAAGDKASLDGAPEALRIGRIAAR